MPGGDEYEWRWFRVSSLDKEGQARLFLESVTGVALLAESHMSIHTWPEHGYAAVDIFLCGARHDPAAALHVLCRYLSPARISQNLVRRGDVSELAREADGQKLER